MFLGVRLRIFGVYIGGFRGFDIRFSGFPWRVFMISSVVVVECF